MGRSSVRALMTRRLALSRRSFVRLAATLATALGGGVQACTPIFGHRIDKLVQAVRNVAVPMAQGATRPREVCVCSTRA